MPNGPASAIVERCVQIGRSFGASVSSLRKQNREDARRIVEEADRARDGGQWGTAAERYRSYLKLFPRDAGIWVQYGHVLKESGNPVAADAAYYEALRRQPWQADTYLQIGHLRKLQHKPDAALFWYRQAIAVNPALRDARLEVEALESQGVVASAEILTVPWAHLLVALRKRLRRAGAVQYASVQSSQVEAGARRVDPFEGAWRQYMPAFIEATSNMAALGHEYARLRRDCDKRWLEQRRDIEALRDQISVLRRPADAKSTSDLSVKTELVTGARIVVEERVEAARRSGRLCLNLGCGQVLLRDHINIDVQDLPGIDVLAEAGNLPFEKGTVDEINSSHLLEHLTEEDLERRLLPYWRSLLKPGGRLVATVPDGVAMIAGAANGTIAFDSFRSWLIGTKEREGNRYANIFSYDSLADLLMRTGFCNIEIPLRARPNGIGLEFEIRACTPEASHD